MRSPSLILLLVIGLSAEISSPLFAAPKRALFDNTHQETAGNADWQIDTDQPLPLPDQSTVTAATPRTTWLGANSSWAIDLVKRGYTVASLTTTYGITYGNGANPYDLSNFDVFIVDEPNTRFNAAESTAIFHYVAEGGGLIAVADHFNSDRNGDGIDSPRVWDRLDAQRLWGASFDTTSALSGNFSDVYSTNVETAPDDSIIHGPNGLADGLEFHNGTSLTLFPALNPAVRGHVWRTGFAHGNTGAMAASTVYGNGRVVWVGDSSPADDGSATAGNSSIFDGWGEANGRDSLLFLNATMWATRRDAGVAAVPTPGLARPRLGPASPNPASGAVELVLELPAAVDGTVEVFDIGGRRVETLARGRLDAGVHRLRWSGLDARGVRVRPGVYRVRARWNGFRAEQRFVLTN